MSQKYVGFASWLHQLERRLFIGSLVVPVPCKMFGLIVCDLLLLLVIDWYPSSCAPSSCAPSSCSSTFKLLFSKLVLLLVALHFLIGPPKYHHWHWQY